MFTQRLYAVLPFDPFFDKLLHIELTPLGIITP